MTSTGEFKDLMSTEVTIANNAQSIETLMMETLQNEKTFLLQKDKRFAVEVEKGIAALQRKAQVIVRVADQAGYEEDSKKANEIIALASAYIKAFMSVVDATEAKGLDSQSGLQGEFGSIGNHLAQNMQAYQVEDLYIALLQMRRYEKDYLNSQSNKDKAYWMDSIKNYEKLLQESHSNKNALDTQKKVLKAYKKASDKWVAIAEGKSKGSKTINYRKVKMRARKLEKALLSIYVPRASELLLEIRKAEKEYLLHGEKKYIDMTHAGISLLSETFKTSGILEEYVLAIEKQLALYRKAFDALVEKDNEIESLTNTMRDVAQRILPQVKFISKNALKTAASKTEATASAAKAEANLAAGIGITVFIMSILLALFIIRSITKPINRIIEGLGDGAEQVAAASGEVSASSQSLAEGASEQAAGIEETSSSLEEMSSMTRQNSDNAGQANKLMGDVRQIVVRANDSMDRLSGAMGEITSASEETSKIIKTIDEIAFQTNLLALNAAVEAARAGEAGAGFAVVADEVRNLALRAAEAAKNTSDLIDGTGKKVVEGSELARSTNEAFGEVAESAGKVGELVGEIAAASKEQAQGIEQVTTVVTEMEKATQNNAASAEESASASEEMNAQAEQMRAYVGKLTNLMGGRKAAPSRKSRMPADVDYAAPSNGADAGKRKALSAPKRKKDDQKEVNPEEVIPFDNKNFEDF